MFSLWITILFASSNFEIIQSQKTAKLGILLPADNVYPYSIGRVSPAIDLAIQKINRIKLLRDYVIVKNVRDSKCSETFGPLEAINLHMSQEVNVFIGPVCDYAVALVARFSPYWNIPVITAGAFAGAFDNKAEYKTLTRVQASYGKNAEFLWDVTRLFNWSHIGILYNHEPARFESERFMVEPIIHMFKEAGLIPWYRQFDANNTQTYDISEILTDVFKETRIFVMCAPAVAVREIMIRAHEMNFDNGEYVFLNIDLYGSKADLQRPWYRPDDSVERNAKARKANEVLMTLTVRTTPSFAYKRFSMDVKQRAEKTYNFTYGEEEVNSYVGAFHDAIILYALALNETLAANKSITEGSEITKRMWNRTFKGITGTVNIDANGDRDGEFALLDMNPTTNTFEEVAIYNGNQNVIRPVPGKQIHWGGSRTSPPPDTPNYFTANSK